MLIAWENDAFLAFQEFGKDQFEIVAPSQSILAEPPVSLVDGNVDAKGTRKVAEAYLNYLYTPEAQKLIAKNYLRPARPDTPTRRTSRAFRRSTSSRSTERSAAGRRRRRPIFADGGVFDDIVKSLR